MISIELNILDGYCQKEKPMNIEIIHISKLMPGLNTRNIYPGQELNLNILTGLQDMGKHLS